MIPDSLTLVGALVAGISGIAAALGVVWRVAERRTDSLLAVNTETIKTLALIQEIIQGHEQSLHRLIVDQQGHDVTCSREHAEQSAHILEIRGAILARQQLKVSNDSGTTGAPA